MINLLRKSCARIKNLLVLDAGQDLVEYALLILVLALGTIAAVPPLATAIAPLLDAVTTALN